MGLFEDVGNAVSGAVNQVGNAVSNAANNLNNAKDQLGNAVNGAPGGLAGMIGGINGMFSEWLRRNVNPNDAFDFLMNAGTGGLLGFQNGKLKRGLTGQAIDETLGEITGRNLMRDQMWEARKRLEQEAIARDKLLQQQREQRVTEDIAMSNMAASLRNADSSGSSGGRRSLMYSGANSSAPKDFLGL